MGRDITGNKRSVAGKIESLISEMENLSISEIKERFLLIIEDRDTHASEKTRAKWRQEASRVSGKRKMMEMLCNLYLKASGNGLTD